MDSYGEPVYQPPYLDHETGVERQEAGELKLRKLYGINITRINRAGVDLVATPGLTLQVGDRVNVVGTETAVSNVEKVWVTP